jgi:hypothetical protein
MRGKSDRAVTYLPYKWWRIRGDFAQWHLRYLHRWNADPAGLCSGGIVVQFRCRLGGGELLPPVFRLFATLLALSATLLVLSAILLRAGSHSVDLSDLSFER